MSCYFRLLVAVGLWLMAVPGWRYGQDLESNT